QKRGGVTAQDCFTSSSALALNNLVNFDLIFTHILGYPNICPHIRDNHQTNHKFFAVKFSNVIRNIIL
ncbi:MAG: hypothetical protein ACK559_04535, partial [bacterium]